MNAQRASYFKNHPKDSEFYFVSNGAAYRNAEAAANNAALLKKKGKSDEVVHVTRDEYEAWLAAKDQPASEATAETKDEAAEEAPATEETTAEEAPAAPAKGKGKTAKK